ncbi:MAG: efflux RND transporter periplasmic adaptor subunit [Pirellulaceae bacterium]
MKVHILFIVVVVAICQNIVFAQTSGGETSESGSSESGSPAENIVTVPKGDWKASGIRIEAVGKRPFSKTLQLTGKIALNEDRLAHIYSMVEGTVDNVSVHLGDRVRAGDQLAVIHSREVGSAKLLLYQARLQLELADTQNTLQSQIAANAQELLAALRAKTDIKQIEEQFRDRPMGDYRERALASYAAYLKSEADVVRLESISDSGAISGKALLAARSKRNADSATFQARIEQIQHELRTSTLMTSQAVREAEAKVLVAATGLKILNVDAKDIAEVDPAEQGETLSHYAIRAPFDGTVLSKDVVLGEQVRPDVMLLSIADLSTVWVTANVYEEHLPLLSSFQDQTLTIRNDALPERAFKARVFYTGEIMDEATRTISLRAIAQNDQHQLKPGMFVNIELPITQQNESIVIPEAAVQQHEGASFVFVLRGADQFVRRDVVLGPSSNRSVIVRSGLNDGESIVVGGGFVLKSHFLADLLGEE